MKRSLITGLVLVFAFVVKGQDLHFSQFYSSPQTINPALTAYFEGEARLGLNYKTQWGSFTAPFETKAAYFDIKYRPESVRKSNWFGLGFNLYDDKSGDAALTNTRAAATLSFHKSLNKLRTFYISVGFLGGVGQKKIDGDALYFGNQWNGVEFDQSINSGELIVNESFYYVDVNTGILISYRPTDFINMYLGGSLQHINKPNDSFYARNNPMKMMGITHLGGSIRATDKIFFEPGLAYMKKGKAQEVIAGTNVVFKLDKDAIFLGAWYRFSGDIAPVLGLTYKNLRLMLGYDYNISGLMPVSQLKGGFEVSAVYVFKRSNYLISSSKESGLICPAF